MGKAFLVRTFFANRPSEPHTRSFFCGWALTLAIGNARSDPRILDPLFFFFFKFNKI